MNLIQDTRIYDKFHNGFIRNYPPKVIVIHGAGGASSIYNLVDEWILTDTFERAEDYKNGEGFPFGIDMNGDVYQFVDPAKIWQWHSGTYRKGANPQYDSGTIGIELMNASFSNQNEYSLDQYGGLCELIIGKLLKEFPTIELITGHGAIQQQITGTYKVCPGPKFKWDILKNELIVNQVNISSGKEFINILQE